MSEMYLLTLSCVDRSGIVAAVATPSRSSGETSSTPSNSTTSRRGAFFMRVAFQFSGRDRLDELASETWKGKMNEEVTVTFDVEGIYGYKCQPHFALGMVGIIQVGDSTDNLDSAETAKLPGTAKSRMAELIAEVSGDGGD